MQIYFWSFFSSIKRGFEIRPFKIWKQLKSCFFSVGFQMVQFSKGKSWALTIAQTIWKLDNSKPENFYADFNSLWQNGSHLSTFQKAGLPNFRYHSKFGLVQISAPQCTVKRYFPQNHSIASVVVEAACISLNKGCLISLPILL